MTRIKAPGEKIFPSLKAEKDRRDLDAVMALYEPLSTATYLRAWLLALCIAWAASPS